MDVIGEKKLFLDIGLVNSINEINYDDTVNLTIVKI